MPVMRGVIGGFFDTLGLGGVATMVFGGVGYSFMHSYVSAKWAKKMAAGGEPTREQLEKAEMYTGGALLVPPFVWAFLRYGGKIPETDAMDMVGNVMGAGMLWELWNGVETLVMKLE